MKKPRKASLPTKRKASLPYVILRCTAAGVHAGELVSHTETQAVLRNSRRLWHWKDSAKCLSDLSQIGVKSPEQCRFGVTIPGNAVITGYCEILPVTQQARNSIERVAQWTM